MRDKIINYFSKISLIYDKKSNSFPWKYIRNFEAKMFKKMISKKKYYKGLDLGSGSGFYTKILKKNCTKDTQKKSNINKFSAGNFLINFNIVW